MKTLLAGATGLIGGHVLELLLKKESVEEVLVLGRNLNRLKDHHKLVKRECSLAELEELPENIDTAFCCLGTTIKKAKSKDAFKEVDHDYPIKIAKLSKKSNPHIHYSVISALGADAGSSVFYNKVKGEMEEDLKELHLQSLHLLRPSLLLGERDESRPMESLGQALSPVLNKLMIGPLKSYQAIHARDVAMVMVDQAFSYPQNATYENLDILTKAKALRK